MVHVRSNRRVMRRPRPTIWFHFFSCLMGVAVLLAYFGWMGLLLYRALPLLPALSTAPERSFVWYNPSSQLTRYLCGDIPLAPQTQMRSTAVNCSSTVSILPSLLWPEHDAEPVRLRFSRSTSGTDFDCDVPCWSAGEVTSQRTIDTPLRGEAPWTVTFSMEGPEYYDHLRVLPDAWRQQHFYATTSYDSEVPLPYYSKADFDIWHQKYVSYDTGMKAAVFLAHNCDSRNQREKIVQDLMAASSSLRIDSLSSCLHNADPPPQVGRDLSNKRHVLQQYLFYLSFENQCVDDYITEKLWGAYDAGTIPVYYGAPNVRDHAPNRSLILVRDFPTTHELAQYLERVAHNRTLYESYHAWRKEPPPPHFRARYDMTDTHSTCRMCRWAYARTHGLGWNHTAQSLRPLLGDVGSRDVCLSSGTAKQSKRRFLVQHPFLESWSNDQGNEVVGKRVASSSPAAVPVREDCPEPLHDGNRVVDIGSWRRTLYNHDGLVDLVMDAKEDAKPAPLSLQLKTLLTAPIIIRNVRDGVWHLQNDITRYTLLMTSLERNVRVQQGSDKSIIEIVVSAPMRLRIVVEDVDTFHKGADQVENYFGTLAAEDFFHPIQMVDSDTTVSAS
jgi:Glycosyltransferase family 10 (fucosyltransferase) C-term